MTCTLPLASIYTHAHSSLRTRAIAFSAFSMLVLHAAIPQEAASFFAGLSSEDSARIESGRIVIRRPKDPARSSLMARGAWPERIGESLADLRPNYATEVMASVDARGMDLANLAKKLSDVGSFLGIPYYSVQFQTTYLLFDKIVLKESSGTPDGGRILALQHMKPFDDFEALYEYSTERDPSGSVRAVRFQCQNVSGMRYQGITAIAPGAMRWYVYCVRVGDRYYFYGIGAARVFDFFGALRDRIETSFVGRVTAFMVHAGGMLGIDTD
jgi:hypothetical protein